MAIYRQLIFVQVRTHCQHKHLNYKYDLDTITSFLPARDAIAVGSP